MIVKEITQVEYLGKKYPVILKKFDNQKTIRLYFKNDKFILTCNRFVSQTNALNVMLKDLDYKGLIEKSKSTIKDPFKEDGVYFLGNFIRNSDGLVNVFNKFVPYKDKKIFYKLIKKDVYKFFNDRLNYYKQVMNIKTNYSLHIKDVSSIYGSNSKKTSSITLNISLIHHSIGEIDSVIVHELAHDRVRNHSNAFYNEILKYFPDYFERDKKLRRGEFK